MRSSPLKRPPLGLLYSVSARSFDALRETCRFPPLRLTFSELFYFGTSYLPQSFDKVLDWLAVLCSYRFGQGGSQKCLPPLLPPPPFLRDSKFLKPPLNQRSDHVFRNKGGPFPARRIWFFRLKVPKIFFPPNSRRWEAAMADRKCILFSKVLQRKA